MRGGGGREGGVVACRGVGTAHSHRNAYSADWVSRLPHSHGVVWQTSGTATPPGCPILVAPVAGAFSLM